MPLCTKGSTKGGGRPAAAASATSQPTPRRAGRMVRPSALRVPSGNRCTHSPCARRDCRQVAGGRARGHDDPGIMRRNHMECRRRSICPSKRWLRSPTASTSPPPPHLRQLHARLAQPRAPLHRQHLGRSEEGRQQGRLKAAVGGAQRPAQRRRLQQLRGGDDCRGRGGRGGQAKARQGTVREWQRPGCRQGSHHPPCFLAARPPSPAPCPPPMTHVPP